MASVVRKQINTSLTAIYDFFSGLNCPLLSISQDSESVTIVIDSEITLIFTMRNPYIYITYDSVQRALQTYGVYTVGYSDVLFYLQVYDAYGRRQLFLYEIVAGNKLFGTNRSSTALSRPFYSIATVPLADLDTGFEYSHTKIIRYVDDTLYVDYLDTDILLLGSTFAFLDPCFITCTTVTEDAIITFGGHNYYSVGANTLLRIDN